VLSRIPNKFVSHSKKEAAVAARTSPRIVAEEALDLLFDKASALGSLDSFILALRTLQWKPPLGDEDTS
jgi:hypothetical protein